MSEKSKDFDVIIIGGGNAALCAALTASESSKKVLLVERSPEAFRGGNSKYTRDIRCCQHPDNFATGEYDEDEFLQDVLRVTMGTTNIDLAKQTIHESCGIPPWMSKQGVKWQKSLKGTLSLSRTNRFFLGGGKALVNTYYERARKSGVKIWYDAKVEDIVLEGDICRGVKISENGSLTTVTCNALVVASGGFEGNISWLKEYWGRAAENFIIRGSVFNDGNILKLLIHNEAKITGDPKQFHAVGVDARSPRYDAGIITRVDSIPFSIMLNKNCERFYDEGEDLWPKRYAIWGKLIAEQPNQIAYSVFDSKVVDRFLPTLNKAFVAPTLGDLSEALRLDSQSFVRTIKTYNAHTEGSDGFDSTILDECRTKGLDPPKSHWALPIDTPPFYAYPLRPGITFTYMGVAVNKSAKILTSKGTEFNNLFAAGEIMAGNILTRGYLAGFGLTIGTTFGRIAGEESSKFA